MSHCSAAAFHYVDTPPDLAALARRLSHARLVALDTEADSLHNYYEKVCLIQLAVEGRHILVDPLAGLDLTEFLAVLAERPLLFHGADYDLRMLRTSLGFRPRSEVHDTLIAAQLVGIQEFGLAALVERFCGVTLTKTKRKTDWSRRPLAPDELAYAVDDVRYLRATAEHLFSELRRLGRYGWYRESCERLVEATAQDRERDPENAWRIKGLRDLDRRQLAFVRELWHWREAEAQRADRPPFMVLGNAQLIALAVWAAAHNAAPLAHGPKLPRNCKGSRLRALEHAVRRARATPKDDWPPRHVRGRQRPGPCADPRDVEALMAACARKAADLGLTPSVLASRAGLEAVAAHRPATLPEALARTPLMRWQAELLWPEIRETLSKCPQRKD